MGIFEDLLPNCVKHAKAMGEIEKRLEGKIGRKKMGLIDGADFFIQVCRTHDEFIGLDELAELLDKTPTVEAISTKWIKQFQEKLTAEIETHDIEGAEALVMILLGGLIGVERMLKEWEEENG